MAVKDNPSLRFPIVFDFKDYLPGDIRYWVDDFSQINEGYVYLGMLRFVLGGDQAEQIYIKRSAGWQLLAGGSSNIAIGTVTGGEVASAKIEERNGVLYLDLVLPKGDAAVINKVTIKMIAAGAEPSGAITNGEVILNLPEAQPGPRGNPFAFDGKGTLDGLPGFDREEYLENTSYLIVDPLDAANHGWLYLKNADGSWTRSINMRGERGPIGPLGPAGPRPWFAYAINQEGLGATFEQNPGTFYWAHLVATERPALASFTNWVKYVAKDGVDGDPGTGGGGDGRVCTSEYQVFTFEGNSSFLLTEGEGTEAHAVEVTVEGVSRILFLANKSVEGLLVTLPNSGKDQLYIGDKVHVQFQSCTAGTGNNGGNPGTGGSRHVIAGDSGVFPDQPNLYFAGDVEITNEVNTTRVFIRRPNIQLNEVAFGLGGINAGTTFNGTLQQFVDLLFSGEQDKGVGYGDLGGKPTDSLKLVEYIESLITQDSERYKGRWAVREYKAGDVVESTNGTGLWEAEEDINIDEFTEHPSKDDGYWRQIEELGRNPYRGVYLPGTDTLALSRKGDIVEVQGAGLYRNITAFDSPLANYTGDPITDTNNWLKIISANSKAEEFNYDQLTIVKNEGKLLIGQQYRVMDYTSKGKKSYGNAIWEGPVEPLTLTASSPNTFHPVVTSSLYPLDEIYYDFDNKLCEDGATPRKGKIDRRIDPRRKIDISCDFRHVKEDRFRAIGLFHHVATFDGAAGFSSLITYGNVDSNPTQYKEWYVYFPNTTHSAGPTLTLTKGAATLTRPIKKVGGVALGVNDIQALLRDNNVYHGLALIHYSPKYDCFYIRNNKIENDLVKDKYIALTGADFSIGKGTRIVVDSQNPKECHMMVTANPDVRNVVIGPNQGRPYPNIVWHSIAGINETYIPENCFDITFNNGLTHDMKLGADCYALAVIGDLRWSRFGNELQNCLFASTGRIGLNTDLNKDAASANNTFFVLQGSNYSFEYENMNNVLTRILNGAGNKISWMYESYLNWNNPLHNNFMGNLANKAWEPEATYSEVLYYKGRDHVAETFTTPKTDTCVLNIELGNAAGGHTILNKLSEAMTARKNLQFIGAVQVSDDAAGEKTVVNVGAVANATELVPGIMKMYSNATEDNTDGTMSQKAIKDYIASTSFIIKDFALDTPYFEGDLVSDGNVIIRVKQPFTASSDSYHNFASFSRDEGNYPGIFDYDYIPDTWEINEYNTNRVIVHNGVRKLIIRVNLIPGDPNFYIDFRDPNFPDFAVKSIYGGISTDVYIECGSEDITIHFENADDVDATVLTHLGGPANLNNTGLFHRFLISTYDQVDNQYRLRDYTDQINKLPIATDFQRGIAKLYDTIGQNEDGAMTQKLVTDLFAGITSMRQYKPNTAYMSTDIITDGDVIVKVGIDNYYSTGTTLVNDMNKFPNPANYSIIARRSISGEIQYLSGGADNVIRLDGRYSHRCWSLPGGGSQVTFSFEKLAGALVKSTVVYLVVPANTKATVNYGTGMSPGNPAMIFPIVGVDQLYTLYFEGTNSGTFTYIAGSNNAEISNPRTLEFDYPVDSIDVIDAVISPDLAGIYTTATSRNLTSYNMTRNGVTANLPINFAVGDEIRITVVRTDTAKATYLIIT